MTKGTLVQLLDVHGKPVGGFLGTVIGFNNKGRVHVHWHTVGSDHAMYRSPLHNGSTRNVAWQWGRLKVLTC